jgi:hypothetical protein
VDALGNGEGENGVLPLCGAPLRKTLASMRIGEIIENLSLATGLAPLTVYFVARIDGAISSRMVLVAFHDSPATAAIKKEGKHEAVWPVEFSLWSRKRIQPKEDMDILLRDLYPGSPLACYRDAGALQLLKAARSSLRTVEFV